MAGVVANIQLGGERDMSKSELMSRVLARDQRAWREFVRAHESALREVAREIVGESEVDDVLGDFWLLLLEDDMRRLRNVSADDIGAWLGVLVSQVAANQARRLARRSEIEPFDEQRHSKIDERIADAVIRMLEQRGIVVPLSTGDLAAANKEGICRDERVKRGGSSGRTTLGAGGDSSSLHQKVDELFNTLRAKRRQRSTSAK
jgi:hypothetical protein